ncbi:MAG: phosphatase PAP2 family protein [Candidatus Tumulicola sp.]
MKALATAIVAFGLFLALGFYVTRAGEPATLVGWEVALANHSSLIAWWLTWGCYVQALGPIAIVLLVVAWRVPSWRGRIIFSVVALLLCWQGADLFQHFFMRPRRIDWVVRRETAFSYPSSHATIATGFYALWAGMLYVSDLPRPVRTAAPACLLLFALAICWSRLALGAHYFTDILGGALLAVALVSTALAVVPVKVFASPAGRP